MWSRWCLLHCWHFFIVTHRQRTAKPYQQRRRAERRGVSAEHSEHAEHAEEGTSGPLFGKDVGCLLPPPPPQREAPPATAGMGEHLWRGVAVIAGDGDGVFLLRLVLGLYLAQPV